MHEGIVDRAFEIHNILGKIEIFSPNTQVGRAIVVHKRDVELLILTYKVYANIKSLAPASNT